MEIPVRTLESAKALVWVNETGDKDELLRATKPLEDYNVYGDSAFGDELENESDILTYNHSEIVTALTRVIESLRQIKKTKRLDSRPESALSAMKFILEQIQELDTKAHFEPYLST